MAKMKEQDDEMWVKISGMMGHQKTEKSNPAASKMGA